MKILLTFLTEKNTLFWTNKKFVHLIFINKLSWYHPKITYENVVQKDMNKFFVFKKSILSQSAEDKSLIWGFSSDKEINKHLLHLVANMIMLVENCIKYVVSNQETYFVWGFAARISLQFLFWLCCTILQFSCSA